MRPWDAFTSAMRISRRRRVKRDEAERLLATGHDSAHPELSRLLAAASAPPRPEELAGLDAALAAFEKAGRVERRAAAPGRPRVLRPLAAVAAVSVLLVGGVAVAAETGYLPGADPSPARQSLESHGAPSSSSRTGPGRTSGPVGSPGHTTGPPPVAPADVAQLCRTWEHRREKDKKPMKPEELSELARAAGGEDRISAFCAPLLEPDGKKAASPAPSTPTAHPSPSHPGPPSEHPGRGRGSGNNGNNGNGNGNNGNGNNDDGGPAR